MTHISVVEDQRDISRSISRAIERRPELQLAGVFADGESALAAIPASRTELVLMDIGLPKMDGIECMVKLKEKRPELEFLMFTVFDADDQLFTALRFGATGYILKSDGLLGAMKAIEELREGGAPMSREVAKRVLLSFRKPPIEPGPLEILTPKQNEVLRLLSEGLYNKEIGDRMNITEGTVRQHLHTIYKKLHVNNRVEARNHYLSR